MSISSSGAVSDAFPALVNSFLYRDIAASVLTHIKEAKQAASSAEQEGKQPAPPGSSAQEVDELLKLARVEAIAETERRLGQEYKARSATEAAKIREAIELFQVERTGYFSRVESEVVHLALAIAAKVLHREAQVDPMLVAALVRVAVDKLHDGSSVSVRVSLAGAGKWRAHLGNPLNGTTIAIIEDPHLGPDDCILETDLGSANFSIDAQLKEVEHGFFDLLAQRPKVR